MSGSYNSRLNSTLYSRCFVYKIECLRRIRQEIIYNVSLMILKNSRNDFHVFMALMSVLALLPVPVIAEEGGVSDKSSVTNEKEQFENQEKSPLEGPPGMKLLTEEQLTNFQFDTKVDYKDPVIRELDLGDQFVLDSKRKSVEEDAIRRLGVKGFERNKSDLKLIQAFIERKLITSTDVKGWQSLGVVFGDVLAKEMNLQWVSYEDELGESKALRWKDTMNFIFPVTIFSKRVQFDQPVNAYDLYMEIQKQVDEFSETDTQDSGEYYRDRSVLEFK